ncbi:12907_t:CDS:2, partial [Funneliformis mosseae]
SFKGTHTHNYLTSTAYYHWMRKLVKTKGPVDITKNFYIPFDILELTSKLEKTINEKMRELIKLVNNRGARGIKLVIFTGSFAITTILEDKNHQVKKVIIKVITGIITG